MILAYVRYCLTGVYFFPNKQYNIYAYNIHWLRVYVIYLKHCEYAILPYVTISNHTAHERKQLLCGIGHYIYKCVTNVASSTFSITCMADNQYYSSIKYV